MSLKNNLKTASWALFLLTICMQAPCLHATSQPKCIVQQDDDQASANQSKQTEIFNESEMKRFRKTMTKGLKKKKSKKVISKSCFSNSDSSDTNTLTVTNRHTIRDLFPKDKTFEIENQAGFTLQDAESIEKMQVWKSNGNSICIWPNSSWNSFMSSSEYLIENSITGETVEAILSRGPLESSPYNSTILSIDSTKGILLIQTAMVDKNGQVYRVPVQYQIGTSWKERDMLKKMEPNDIIIFGNNRVGSIFPSDYDTILINIALDGYVTAKQVSGPQVPPTKVAPSVPAASAAPSSAPSTKAVPAAPAPSAAPIINIYTGPQATAAG